MCGTIVRASDPWMSADSIHLIDLRRDIPAYHEYDASYTAIRPDLKRSVRPDRKNCSKRKAAKIEGVHAIENSS